MSNNKEDYIGKRLSLKEIKRLFPDKWAIIKDYVFENGSIDDGVLVEVLDFEDANKFMQAHMGERLYRFRTTENMHVGYINGVFINKDDYIGKEMSWHEAMALFPDRWVIMKDYKMDGPTLLSGTVCDVMTNKEAEERYNNYLGEEYIAKKTTEWNGGFIDVRIMNVI